VKTTQQHILGSNKEAARLALECKNALLRQIQTMPTQQTRLKLDDLPAGIYYCRIAHLNQTAKFVKL